MFRDPGDLMVGTHAVWWIFWISERRFDPTPFTAGACVLTWRKSPQDGRPCARRVMWRKPTARWSAWLARHSRGQIDAVAVTGLEADGLDCNALGSDVHRT